MNISQVESDMILKIRQIVSKGNSAEVKQTKDGGLTVYEVEKRKR